MKSFTPPVKPPSTSPTWVSAARRYRSHAATSNRQPPPEHVRLVASSLSTDDVSNDAVCARICGWKRVCGVCQSPLPPCTPSVNVGDARQSRCLWCSAQLSQTGLIPPTNNRWRKEKREFNCPSVCLSVSWRLPGIPVEMVHQEIIKQCR